MERDGVERLLTEAGADSRRLRHALGLLCDGQWWSLPDLVRDTATSRRTIEALLRELVLERDGDRFRVPLTDTPAYQHLIAVAPPPEDPVAHLLPHYRPALDRLTTLIAKAPRARHVLDHVSATPETVLRRALLLGARFWLPGTRLLCVGDHDLTSLAVKLVHPETDVTVVDVDERILAYIDEQRLGVRTRWADLRLGLPPSAKDHDLALTDPPYTPEGIGLFVARAVEGLKDGGRVLLAYGASERTPLLAFKVQQELSELNLAYEAIYPDFNRYFGAEAIGSAADLYLLRPTTKTRPAVQSRLSRPTSTAIYTQGPQAVESASSPAKGGPASPTPPNTPRAATPDRRATASRPHEDAGSPRAEAPAARAGGPSGQAAEADAQAGRPNARAVAPNGPVSGADGPASGASAQAAGESAQTGGASAQTSDERPQAGSESTQAGGATGQVGGATGQAAGASGRAGDASAQTGSSDAMSAPLAQVPPSTARTQVVGAPAPATGSRAGGSDPLAGFEAELLVGEWPKALTQPRVKLSTWLAKPYAASPARVAVAVPAGLEAALPRLLLASRAPHLRVVGPGLTPRLPAALSSVYTLTEAGEGVLDVVRLPQPESEVDTILRRILDNGHGKLANTWREALIALARAQGTTLTKNEARTLIREAADWSDDLTPLEAPLHRLTALRDAVTTTVRALTSTAS
ncbi:bis-aminopropyl spermidine synthase family protein [[Actinomadura] parvosata]|uniref:bis-aminopropyl spermidine synthase family protein n=1 Tax=[Actinomadura] parvosata TaxID=1955412 RepID=UPI00406D0050